MKFPEELTEAIVRAAAKELIAHAGDIEDLQLVPIRKAAAMLAVSEPKARQLFREYVELGEASKRVSLRTVRRLIEARTIMKAPTQRGRRGDS